MSEEFTHAHQYVAESVVKYLCSELQERGIDAFDTGLTYGEVADGKGEDADYYVEIVGAAESGSRGGIGVGTYDIGVSVDVVVSRVVGEVRVYDGPTGEMLKQDALAKRNTAVMPTSIYLGGSRLFAVVAMPFVQRSQYKTLTRAAARDAAMVVVSAIQPQ